MSMMAEPDAGMAPDPDDDPVAIAEAIDATIDAAAAALAAHDLGQCAALLFAADIASDALLVLLGGVDADDQ